MSIATCEFVPDVRDEDFVAATEQLRQALAGRLIGREQTWADEVGTALKQLLSALRCHIGATPLRPQAAETHREHFHLLEQICGLQKCITEVTQAFSLPPYTAFDQVLGHGQQLIGALRRHQEKEAAVSG